MRCSRDRACACVEGLTTPRWALSLHVKGRVSAACQTRPSCAIALPPPRTTASCSDPLDCVLTIKSSMMPAFRHSRR